MFHSGAALRACSENNHPSLQAYQTESGGILVYVNNQPYTDTMAVQGAAIYVYQELPNGKKVKSVYSLFL